MLDKIFIKGLAVDAIIGIYPHEKAAKQRLLLDLDLFLDTTLPAKTGLITDTIDYDLVSQRIIEIVDQTQYNLIESLIQHIADVILQEFKIPKLRCTLHKPQALSKAQTVGITVVRSQI